MSSIDTNTHPASSSLTFGELRVGERLTRAIPQLLAAAAMLCAGSVASAQTTMPGMTVWATYYGGGLTGGSSGGGGWGVNNPTTNGAYTNPPAPPFNCANHLANRPPSCPTRPAVPNGPQYYGGNLQPGSALDRIREYIDLVGAGSQTGTFMINALAHHTQAILDGRLSQADLNYGVLLDINLPCYQEAVAFAAAQNNVFSANSSVEQTPAFQRMASCYAAMDGLRVELGVGADMWSTPSSQLSSMFHTPITVSPNAFTRIGPGSIGIKPGNLTSSLNQKYAQGRADLTCGLWYYEAELEGCNAP